MLDRLVALGYEIRFVSHAAAILGTDFAQVLVDLEESLVDFSIPIEEIIGGGGGEAQGTQRLRHALNDRGWQKINFELKKTINGVERESISHEIDHVKHFECGTIALEIEWNNKDPFFDRDLENFKRLHSESGISVGVIITRGADLQNSMRELVLRFALEHNIQSVDDLRALGLDPTRRQRELVQAAIDRERHPIAYAEAWAHYFVADKFGAATTHWSKLSDRVDRGVGNPCPLLLIGLPSTIVTFPH